MWVCSLFLQHFIILHKKFVPGGPLGKQSAVKDALIASLNPVADGVRTVAEPPATLPFTESMQPYFHTEVNNSIIANAVYRVFWYTGSGSIRFFSTVAEKPVNNYITAWE